MDIGDFDAALLLANQVGDNVLREVLKQAQAGWFNDRSWHYWHYRLGLAQVDQVPPPPVRTFSD